MNGCRDYLQVTIGEAICHKKSIPPTRRWPSVIGAKASPESWPRKTEHGLEWTGRAVAGSMDTDQSFLSLLEPYRADLTERRVSARRVVEALDHAAWAALAMPAQSSRVRCGAALTAGPGRGYWTASTSMAGQDDGRAPRMSYRTRRAPNVRSVAMKLLRTWPPSASSLRLRRLRGLTSHA
jgi:hypothetical protein